VTYVIHFDPDPPKWWQTLIAWAIIIGLCFAFLSFCVAPVSRDIGEALQKELDRQKAEQAAKTPGGAPR